MLKLPNRKEMIQLIDYPNKLIKKVNKLKVDKETKKEIKRMLIAMQETCIIIENTYVAFDMMYYGRPLMNPYLMKTQDIMKEINMNRDYPFVKKYQEGKA